MRPDELLWLAQRACTHQRIVEVGSWSGRSTRALADNTPGRVWAIDTFLGSKEHQPLLSQKPQNWLYEQFLENTKGLSNLEVMRMTSLEASKKLQDERFDMVFIDASHDYQSVKQDIEAWLPLMLPGALFSGHDYNYASVKQAVDECLPAIPRVKAFSPIEWPTPSLWYTTLP
jgi:hypothetical protein